MSSTVPSLSIVPDERWVVCHCRPRCEKKLSTLLLSEKVDHFLPLLKQTRQYGRHTRHSSLPLFPGYLFARVHPDRKAKMFQQELLARMIPVPDEALLLRQLADVRKVIDSGLEVLRYDQIALGKRVKVISGPLYGVEGRVENVTSPRGIVISVDVLQKGLFVTVPILQLEVLP